jgi:hypothetical protein
MMMMMTAALGKPRHAETWLWTYEILPPLFTPGLSGIIPCG